MNKTQDKTKQEPTREANPAEFKHPRHPYFMSNSREETLRRMRTFPERAAKFLEQWHADREKNSR